MKKIVLCWGFIALAFVSCTSEKDVFDPNYNKELGMTVPEGFEWSTTQAVTVNVAVNDEYDGKYYYAVRLYDKAPAPGILPVAAAKEVTGEMPFSQRVVIPATVSKLYISQVFKQANAKEVVTTREVAINGTTVEYSFGTPKRSRSIKARDGKSLKTGETITTPGDYYIPAGETIHVNAGNGNLKGVDIEVDGTLIFDGDASLHEWEIDVEKHGTVEVKGNLELVGNKKHEDKSSSLENEGYVHITGNLTVHAGASLDNDDNDDGKYMGGCIIVDGEAHFQSNKIELDERSYMSCKDMKLNGSDMRIYMETGAWLRVTGELTSAQNCEIGFGDDDEGFKTPGTEDKIKDTKYVALIQVGSWGNQGNRNLTTREEILVECPDPGKHNIVSWTDDASKEITIVGTTCSGSIGDDEETAVPVCTYALEDQEIDKGDYDMNDIVVVVTSNQYHSSKKTWTITGQVVAAGATNKIVPYFQYGITGEKVYLFPNKGSAYEAFGLSGSPVPVNTEASEGKKADSVPFSVELEDVESNPQIDMLNFGIEVKGESINWKEHGKGSAARALQVSTLFKYPKERIRITEAYPGFSDWVNANKSRSAAWYKEPVEELVVTPKLQ